MNVLLKKALTWTLVFLLWTFVSAWLFVLVEKTEKDDVKEKNQLLRSLYKSMATKYNMSIEEFNNFSKVAHDALADPKLEWNFFAAVDFVFQSLTTIGKKKYIALHFITQYHLALQRQVGTSNIYFRDML